VLVETDMRSSNDKGKDKNVPDSAKGMRRLKAGARSVNIEEQNNVVTISRG